MHTFLRLLKLAAPFRWWMALAAFLGFLTIGSSIGLMSTAAWIIASAALHPSLSKLEIAIVGVRFFGITRGVFRYLERLVAHQTTFRLLARLRVWFYRALEPLAPARLQEYRSGDLLARAVADIDTLENVYLRVIAPPVIAVLVGLLMMVFMGAFNGWLALSLLFFLLLVGVGVPVLTRALSRESGRALVHTRADLNTALVDGVQGLADLLAYGAQERHLAHIQALNRDLQHQQVRLARIAALNTALTTLLVGLATLATLTIAIPLVNDGRLDGVMLAVLALATMTSFEAVQPLPAAFQHLESNLAAARRLFELVDAKPEITQPGTDALRDVDTTALSLQVEELRFRYTPDDPPALDGISFSLPPGHTLAIVGASGAGKSTLVNLLLRFWEYDEGDIRLGERSLRDYSPDTVRTQIAVVGQSTYLFNTTIRENLLLARRDATRDDLVHAAQAAQLHDFITGLPNGYDTWVGEQGLALSGGERQRLAVARALLKDAPLLVLDEPTANLDPTTERAVLDTIHTALAHRTTLMITHRLVGLEHADNILVLDGGRSVEYGQHHDLLDADGAYRRLWETQHDTLTAV
ncbi:MAG: thiol reductant ABC exporter subunit CydC [Chloroflexi bacterium]|nr:thiol reductant ABC exporter subunit CydC [Chloroflexota bacterium]